MPWRSAASDLPLSRRTNMIKLKIRYADDQTELSFPCTEQAMQDAITEIRADPIIGPAELYVVEVIFPEELDFLQDRFVNLD